MKKQILRAWAIIDRKGKVERDGGEGPQLYFRRDEALYFTDYLGSEGRKVVRVRVIVEPIKRKERGDD
jgi:hypothetical protein